ncbi:MAG: hypothetical protein SGBAC_010710 [Bacillariaceae sp.]
MLEAALTMMLGKDMVSLADELSTLGGKHVTYGIQPPHYIIVESALVRTLELGLGDNFTLSLRKDWEAVFRFISRTMMMGAGIRVEIVKSQRRTAEQKKVATLRLNAISQGKRSKVLTRNSRTGFSRFEGEPKGRRRRRGSDPPRQPTRKGTVESYHRFSRSLSDLEDDLSLEDRTVDETAETSTITEHGEAPGDAEAYWAWGNDSNVEPPRIPQRGSRANAITFSTLRMQRICASTKSETYGIVISVLNLTNGMAEEAEDTDYLVNATKEEEKMPSEEIEVAWDSDGESLGSRTSTSKNAIESSELSQLMVDSIPAISNVPSSTFSSASNSVLTDLESNQSITHNQDYAYDDDVPFSYYAPLKTKERSAPLVDHQKSKKQKKQEKKERKKEIKKERQEVQQHRMMEQQEKVTEPNVEPDQNYVPQYSLSTTMAGLAMSAVTPNAAPYTNPTFLYDTGEVEIVGENDDDDDDEDFSIDGLESIKLAKSKRKSINVNQNNKTTAKKSSSNNSDKKKKKKRGRRADYEAPEEGDEHATTKHDTATPPAHTTKDVAARVEAIFTNKDKILEEFDEYIERIGEEQKELEEMLEKQRGRNRSNSVSSKKSHRGRSPSMSKPKHSGRSQSKGARSVSKSTTKRRKDGKEEAVTKHSVEDTLKYLLGETSKPPENRRSSLANGRSKSEFLVNYIRNTSKEDSGPKSVASSSKDKKKGKSEDLTLEDSKERLQYDARRLPRRSTSFPEVEDTRRADKKDPPTNNSKNEKMSVSKETLQVSEEVAGSTNAKAKAKTPSRKGKKGNPDPLTLDDAAERPISASKGPRRQSSSYSDLDRLKSAKTDSSTNQKKGDKVKLSSKTLQSLSEDMLGKSKTKTKAVPKGFKGKTDKLKLGDSGGRPLSISQGDRRKSSSYSDLEGRKAADKQSLLNHDSKNEKMRILTKTLESQPEDIATKLSSKKKTQRKGKKEQQEALTLKDSVERPLAVSKGLRRQSSSYSELEGAKRSHPSASSRNSDFGARKAKLSGGHIKGKKNARVLSISEHGATHSAMKRKGSKRNVFDGKWPLEPAVDDYVLPLAPPSRPKLKKAWSSARTMESEEDGAAIPTDLERGVSLGLEHELKRPNKKQGSAKAESPSIKSRRKNGSPKLNESKRSRSPKRNQHKRSQSPAGKLKSNGNEGLAGSDDAKEKTKLSRTRSKSLTKAGKRNSENGTKEVAGKKLQKTVATESDHDLDSDMESSEEFASTVEQPVAIPKSSKIKSNENSITATAKPPADIDETPAVGSPSSKTNMSETTATAKPPADMDEKPAAGSKSSKQKSSENVTTSKPSEDKEEKPAAGSKPSKPKPNEDDTTTKIASDTDTVPKATKKKTHKKTRSGGSIDFDAALDEIASAVVDEVSGSEAPKMRKSTGIPNPDLSKHKLSPPLRKGKKPTDQKKNGLSATMH